MPVRPGQLLGQRAEATARRFLQRQGLRCIDRNVRCRYGEVDLVMLSQDLVVFVEVRCRRAGNPINAVASVDARKQQKLAKTAAWYLSRRPQLQAAAVRFDVIAIDGRSNHETALQWIRDAFRPGAW